jgi:hypothetical protein
LSRDNHGIVDVFTSRYQATAAVHRVTAPQRVYTPQYYLPSRLCLKQRFADWALPPPSVKRLLRWVKLGQSLSPIHIIIIIIIIIITIIVTIIVNNTA